MIFEYNEEEGLILRSVGTVPSQLKENILLNENKKYFEEIANYGLKNNLNQNLALITVSKGFKVTSEGRCFSIYMTSKLMDLLYKNFSLNYYYSQNRLKSKIITPEGIFNINSNVPGVNKILSSSMNEKYFWDEELNSTLGFLQNLRVYESDVPEYLKEEIEKVKVLKK